MPILIGVSPSALMMNGDVTCRAPIAPAALITVRRLNALNEVLFVIVDPPNFFIVHRDLGLIFLTLQDYNCLRRGYADPANGLNSPFAHHRHAFLDRNSLGHL